MLLLGGWVFALDAGEHVFAELRCREALESWMDLGLGWRLDDDGVRRFDPAEVHNVMKWACLSGRDAFWTERFVSTGRSLVNEFADAPRCSSVPADMPREARKFHVMFERGFELHDFSVGERLRLRMPHPLMGDLAGTLRIEPKPAYHNDTVTCGDGWQDVRHSVHGDRNVSIGADFYFTSPSPSCGQTDQLGSAEADLYLRPTEGLIRVTPRIEALAETLAGAGLSAMATVTAFWEYMIDTLAFGMIHYDDVHPNAAGDWVLDTGWCDCQLGAALLASLCRSRHIPARLVGGHLLYRLAPANHYWTEVWVDGRGWLPFDFLGWDLSAGGRDVPWRDHFAGAVDARMVTYRPPRLFTGPMSVRFPPSWHMIQARRGSGIRITFLDLAGRLIHHDDIDVRIVDAASSSDALDSTIRR